MRILPREWRAGRLRVACGSPEVWQTGALRHLEKHRGARLPGRKSGANRDYMVETADGTTLRIVTSTENAVARGTEVWLTLPPERCRALSR